MNITQEQDFEDKFNKLKPDIKKVLDQMFKDELIYGSAGVIFKDNKFKNLSNEELDEIKSLIK